MKKNNYSKLIAILIFFIVLFAGGTLPFYFESPSIYYKTGMDKWMLRAGKILGIYAAILMCFQLILISRFPGLDKIWGLKTLFQYHRINGLILLFLAMAHPVLILGADHFVFFPFELKYWPEFIGILLLVILAFFVMISHWQKKLGIGYKAWRVLHKLIAPVIIGLMLVHVFNVSRTFESGIPFFSLVAVGLTAAALLIRKYLK